jgi:hypothetical protein
MWHLISRIARDMWRYAPHLLLHSSRLRLATISITLNVQRKSLLQEMSQCNAAIPFPKVPLTRMSSQRLLRKHGCWRWWIYDWWFAIWKHERQPRRRGSGMSIPSLQRSTGHESNIEIWDSALLTTSDCLPTPECNTGAFGRGMDARWYWTWPGNFPLLSCGQLDGSRTCRLQSSGT